ncbi:3-isopropylmalate dehydrogenase [Alkalicaulis satelles]|uniref:3-isopropylmalate dehydrogenase n=1 Tax=Alkalicaulis satelles TaxID=2609175 RepID=A0A5M6ZAT6_9PROT|nr:3-isopropylmalate dehydrogenase [Alkalicaulis satelles]KAA5801014.1 3-isopropylmalate dehydrogenase [Alkalicaulis satelles]
MTAHILLLPGDGIGPEVTAAARVCLEAAASRAGLSLSFDEAPFGGAGIDACGSPLPEETLQKARASDAVFLGAVGGPAWDSAPQRPEAGLLGLRKALGLFANLRPVKVMAGLEDFSPLRPERVRGADLLIVRELTGGLYFGAREEGRERASDSCVYTAEEVTRIARVAFEAARGRSGRVTSVDKANVLATSRLWRAVVEDVARDFPDVALDHQLVDSAAMALVTNPARFDVILTENLFGDILSDEAAVIAGSIGLLGSASLGADGPGLFEPIHGSAPDIAGQDKANPAGAIASAALLLRHGLKQAEAADRLEAALEAQLRAGPLTADLGGDSGCAAFAEKVAAHAAQA